MSNSLMTSTEVSQPEKNMAIEAVKKLTQIINAFDVVLNDVKKLNNAIVNFQKEDPEEFKKLNFKQCERRLDKDFKIFVKEINSVFLQLEAIGDNELERIKENILINIDNLVELLNQLYVIFEDPTKDFKNLVSTKIGEIVHRSEDFKRLMKEELIDHLMVDVVGQKRKIIAYFEKRRIERIAKWLSPNILMQK